MDVIQGLDNIFIILGAMEFISFSDMSYLSIEF